MFPPEEQIAHILEHGVIHIHSPCQPCGGNGILPNYIYCSACSGTGTVTHECSLGWLIYLLKEEWKVRAAENTPESEVLL